MGARRWGLALIGGLALAQPARGADRVLRAALYPYIPAKAEAYWAIEERFEAEHPGVDLQQVDLAADYYDGGLVRALQDRTVDVVEVDTVFLDALVRGGLIAPLDDLDLGRAASLAVAEDASRVDGVRYGLPHWVCGNFLFARADDPDLEAILAVQTLTDLEALAGPADDPGRGLYVDLRGPSTLGEKYLDALFDLRGPRGALQQIHGIDPADPAPGIHRPALAALDRLFALCPGGLCDSDKHHQHGQFYSRAFARGEVRFLVGYSERMYFVTDAYLHSIADGAEALGRITWGSTGATGDPGVVALSAPPGRRPRSTAGVGRRAVDPAAGCPGGPNATQRP